MRPVTWCRTCRNATPAVKTTRRPRTPDRDWHRICGWSGATSARLRSVESVLYFENHVVTDPGTVPGIEAGMLLTDEEYYEEIERHSATSSRR